MESHLLVLVLLVLAIAAHFRINGLQTRLNELDPAYKKDQKALERQTRQQIKQVGTVAKDAHAHKQARPKPSALLKWLSTDWPMKLGAFLLLLAFAWLTSYAFINNWIGPMGRIALGVGAGALLMCGGEWRIRKYKDQGSVFLALGAATVLVSLFAARTIYDFFTPLTALLGMFVAVAFMGISSLRHKSLALSVVGLAMGGVAPLLVNSPSPDYFGLFSYLLVLTLGALTVAQRTGWKLLSFLSFLLVFFYSGASNAVESDKPIGLILASIFITLFYASNLLGVWKAKHSTGLDMATAIGTGLLLLFWMDEMLPFEYESIAFAGMGVALIVASYTLLRRMKRPEKITYVYYVTAAVVLMFAALFEWSGSSLTLVLTWGAAGLLALPVLATKDPRQALYLSGFLFPAALNGTPYYNTSTWGEVFYQDLDFLSLISQSVVLLGLAYFLRSKKTFFIFLGLMCAQVVALTLLAATIFYTENSQINLVYMAVMVPFMALLSVLFKDKLVNRLLPTLLVPAVLLNSDPTVWPEGTLLHTDFYALLSLVLVTLGLGVLFKRNKDEIAKLYFTVSGLFAMKLVWLSADALLENPNLHITVALAIYTLAGLYFNIRGAMENEKASRIAGGALIGFVVLRLLLVDVWSMSIGAKVITFFLVGALLISTAFFNRGKKKGKR